MSRLEAVRRYRERQRDQGMRQLNVWVYDTKAPGFAEECRRQSRLLAEHDAKTDIGCFEEAVLADIEGWEA